MRNRRSGPKLPVNHSKLLNKRKSEHELLHLTECTVHLLVSDHLHHIKAYQY